MAYNARGQWTPEEPSSPILSNFQLLLSIWIPILFIIAIYGAAVLVIRVLLWILRNLFAVLVSSLASDSTKWKTAITETVAKPRAKTSTTKTELVPTTLPTICTIDSSSQTTIEMSISIPTTLTLTEQCTCPTPALTAAPPSASLETSGLFWPIYIPLVAVVIATIGSHIYFKHRILHLEHKLDKEIEAIRVDKGKGVELQGIKAGTPVAGKKTQATNPLDTGEVQGMVVGEGVTMLYRLIPTANGDQ